MQKYSNFEIFLVTNGSTECGEGSGARDEDIYQDIVLGGLNAQKAGFLRSGATCILTKFLELANHSSLIPCCKGGDNGQKRKQKGVKVVTKQILTHFYRDSDKP